MTSPYDHEALWTKAKLFLNRAMDDEPPRTFDEQALWASLALELLAKAALAKVSPLLIAEPKEDGTNLLIATGLVQGEARFISVRAETLFKRCAKAFKPFSLAEATQINNARNEYLHGSGAGFHALPAEVWWARFWAQATILVTAQDRDVEELVGPSREAVVQAHLARNAKHLEHRLESLIERARQRLVHRQSGAVSERFAAELDSHLDLSASLRYRDAETCPACGSVGVLEGEDEFDRDYEYESPHHEDEFPSVRVVLHIGADYFSCNHCRLVLDGYELIEQADMATSFTVEGDPMEHYEAEYGND